MGLEQKERQDRQAPQGVRVGREEQVRQGQEHSLDRLSLLRAKHSNVALIPMRFMFSQEEGVVEEEEQLLRLNTERLPLGEGGKEAGVNYGRQ